MSKPVGNPKKDWVDDLIDSGLTGHKPRGKFVKKSVGKKGQRGHKHRYEYWEDINEAPLCNLLCFCGKPKPTTQKEKNLVAWARDMSKPKPLEAA